MKKFNMLVVRSTMAYPSQDALSLRDEHRSASGLKYGLAFAGFKPGDEVVMVERAALEELLARCGE